MIKDKKINEQPIYLNYNKNIKFMGIIDYKSLIIIVIYIVVIFNLLKILPFSLEILTYVFLILVIPVVAVFCVNLNNESTIEVIATIIKFMIYKKVFVSIKDTKYFEPTIYKKVIINKD